MGKCLSENMCVRPTHDPVVELGTPPYSRGVKLILPQRPPSAQFDLQWAEHHKIKQQHNNL